LADNNFKEKISVNKIVAGLLAGLPLVAVFGIYFALRGKALVEVIVAESGESLTAVPGNAMLWGMGTSFILVAFVFGIIASLVYGAVGSQVKFLGIALGAAVVLSVLAIISRTPLIGDKVSMHFAVALVLGLAVPWIAG